MKKEKTFGDLKKRLITSTVAILSLVLLLVFSYYPWIDYLLTIVVMGVAFLAIWEWIHLAEGKGLFLPKKLLFLLSIGQIAAFFLAEKIDSPMLPLEFFFAAVLLIFLFHFRKVKESLSEVSIASLGLLYLIIPLGMIVSILYGPISEYQDGRWWIAYLLIVTKITDIAAYFCGKLCGKRKLAPIISPRKTWEGALGGFIFAVGVSIGFSFLSQEGIFSLPLPGAIFLGAILGAFAQIGDLSESLLKRDVKVKDSSALPGLGGVLDTLDSLLFNTPILFFFLSRF